MSTKFTTKINGFEYIYDKFLSELSVTMNDLTTSNNAPLMFAKFKNKSNKFVVHKAEKSSLTSGEEYNVFDFRYAYFNDSVNISGTQGVDIKSPYFFGLVLLPEQFDFVQESIARSEITELVMHFDTGDDAKDDKSQRILKTISLNDIRSTTIFSNGFKLVLIGHASQVKSNSMLYAPGLGKNLGKVAWGMLANKTTK